MRLCAVIIRLLQIDIIGVLSIHCSCRIGQILVQFKILVPAKLDLLLAVIPRQDQRILGKGIRFEAQGFGAYLDIHFLKGIFGYLPAGYPGILYHMHRRQGSAVRRIFLDFSPGKDYGYKVKRFNLVTFRIQQRNIQDCQNFCFFFGRPVQSLLVVIDLCLTHFFD